jgi:sec-independent protein translocase protein TatA
MLRAFEPWHLVIISGVALVLFGAKRLPDSARSIGQSLRILRSETAAMGAAPEQSAPLTSAAASATPAPAPAPAAPASAAAPTPTPAGAPAAPDDLRGADRPADRPHHG